MFLQKKKQKYYLFKRLNHKTLKNFYRKKITGQELNKKKFEKQIKKKN